MEELVQQLVAKVGISEEQAKGVYAFLKENAHKVPEWLAAAGLDDAIKDKLPGGLGGMLGGD